MSVAEELYELMAKAEELGFVITSIEVMRSKLPEWHSWVRELPRENEVAIPTSFGALKITYEEEKQA